MTIYLAHAICGHRIAKYMKPEPPGKNYNIRSKDFVLMNGRRPKPFGPIVCLHCKCKVQIQDLCFEDDSDAIDRAVTPES